jgi:hypothetical protein
MRCLFTSSLVLQASLCKHNSGGSHTKMKGSTCCQQLTFVVLFFDRPLFQGSLSGQPNLLQADLVVVGCRLAVAFAGSFNSSLRPPWEMLCVPGSLVYKLLQALV